MAKFIELHENGTARMINLDHILHVAPVGNQTTMMDSRGNLFWADESYEQVRKLIAAAQGGIPMQPSKMY